MMTMTIVATVGLGIGATTVIFGAVNAALLRPLPYADPDRLVRIYTDAPPNRFRFSVADYLALQTQQTQFDQIAGYTDRAMAFSDGTVAERLRGRVVSWTYFALLGIRPQRKEQPPCRLARQRDWRVHLGRRARLSAAAQTASVRGVASRRTGRSSRRMSRSACCTEWLRTNARSPAKSFSSAMMSIARA